MVYLSAGWCGPCVAIKKYRSEPKMRDAFVGVAIIELDVDEWKAADLAALGMKSTTIPVFYFVDKDGKSTGKSIDGGAWGDNIPKNMAPPLKAFFSQS